MDVTGIGRQMVDLIDEDQDRTIGVLFLTL
jgi:hypothetical protein